MDQSHSQMLLKNNSYSSRHVNGITLTIDDGQEETNGTIYQQLAIQSVLYIMD